MDEHSGEEETIIEEVTENPMVPETPKDATSEELEFRNFVSELYYTLDQIGEPAVSKETFKDKARGIINGYKQIVTLTGSSPENLLAYITSHKSFVFRLNWPVYFGRPFLKWHEKYSSPRGFVEYTLLNSDLGFPCHPLAITELASSSPAKVWQLGTMSTYGLGQAMRDIKSTFKGGFVADNTTYVVRTTWVQWLCGCLQTTLATEEYAEEDSFDKDALLNMVANCWALPKTRQMLVQPIKAKNGSVHNVPVYEAAFTVDRLLNALTQLFFNKPESAEKTRAKIMPGFQKLSKRKSGGSRRSTKKAREEL